MKTGEPRLLTNAKLRGAASLQDELRDLVRAWGIDPTFAALDASSRSRDSEVFAREAANLREWLDELTGKRTEGKTKKLQKAASKLVLESDGIPVDLARRMQFGDLVSVETLEAARLCAAAVRQLSEAIDAARKAAPIEKLERRGPRRRATAVIAALAGVATPSPRQLAAVDRLTGVLSSDFADAGDRYKKNRKRALRRLGPEELNSRPPANSSKRSGHAIVQLADDGQGRILFKADLFAVANSEDETALLEWMRDARSAAQWSLVAITGNPTHGGWAKLHRDK